MSEAQINQIIAKIDGLESTTKKSLSATKTIYTIIIAIIAFYAIFVPNKLAEATEPAMLSALVLNLVEDKIPSNDELLNHVGQLVNTEIQRGFAEIDQNAPALKKKIITAVDQNFGTATEALNDVIQTEVAAMLKEAKAKIDQDKSIATDVDAIDALANDLAEGVSLTIGQTIDEKLKIDALHAMLEKLNSKENLTEKELTQKKVIAYAWMLANDEEYRAELKDKALDLAEEVNQEVE